MGRFVTHLLFRMDQVQNNLRSEAGALSPLRYFLRYWVPVVVWMFVIFSASGDTQSAQRSDSLLARLLGWLHLHPNQSQLDFLRWLIRKSAHVAEYAILSALCWRALRMRQVTGAWSWVTAILTFAFCAGYAATDEFHQSFVKERSGSFVDVGIDSLGALLALFVLWFLHSRRIWIKQTDTASAIR